MQLTGLLGGKLPSTTVQEMLFGPEDPRLTAVRQEDWPKMADQPLYKKLGKELQQEAACAMYQVLIDAFFEASRETNDRLTLTATCRTT